MSEWKKARKKPIMVEYREPNMPYEIVHTLEGDIFANFGIDFIIRGIDEEEYPIKKTIFYKTYDIQEETK